MSRSLLEEYINMSIEYGTAPFSLKDASRLVRKPPKIMRNDIYKLKKSLNLVPLGYGKYELVEPGRWINIALTIERFPQLKEFFKRILPKLRGIDMIMLYGSRIRGDYREDSDFDILIVTKDEGVLSEVEIEELEKMGFSIYQGSLSHFIREIRESPIMVVPILIEGQPIFNGHIKTELLRKFRWKNFLKDFEEIGTDLIKYQHSIHKGMDDDLKRSILYLTFVRFRHIYLMETLIMNQRYTIKGLLEKLKANWKGDVERVYNIYRKVHYSKRPNVRGVPEKQLSSFVKYSQGYLEEVMNKYTSRFLK